MKDLTHYFFVNFSFPSRLFSFCPPPLLPLGWGYLWSLASTLIADIHFSKETINLFQCTLQSCNPKFIPRKAWVIMKGGRFLTYHACACRMVVFYFVFVCLFVCCCFMDVDYVPMHQKYIIIVRVRVC